VTDNEREQLLAELRQLQEELSYESDVLERLSLIRKITALNIKLGIDGCGGGDEQR